MKKIFLFFFAFVTLTCSAQKVNDSTETLDENVILMKEYIDDVRDNRRTEYWMAVTDSIVYRFELVYDTESGELIRKIQKDGRTRAMFDRMNRDKEWILAHQEELRQQTIEAVNRWRSSPQVWMMFHIFNLIDTKGKKR